MVHPKICQSLLLITLKTFDHIENILNVVKKWVIKESVKGVNMQKSTKVRLFGVD